MHILGPDGNPIKKAEAVFDEVSSAARDDIAAPWIGEVRAHQDAILAMLPGGVKAYKKLLDDDQVQSTYQQRRRAITSREWEVVPGGDRPIDQEAADWTKETLQHVDIDRVVDKMHFGVFYGYAVAEMIYVPDGKRVQVDAIKVRDRTRFRWGRDFDLRLLTADAPYKGEAMPRRKFWTFSTGSDHDDDPYGIGLAHYCYWPVFFKRNWTKDWLIFGEKFASPTPIGRFEPGTPQPEQDKLLAALAAIRTDLGIIMPNTMDVEKFEALRTGTGTYEPLYNKLNEAISKIVLSQTMTTDDGSSRSQAEVHEGVAEDIQKSDAKLILGSFCSGTPFSEAPLHWLIEWNFPGAEVPEVRYVFEEEEDLKDVAERDVAISKVGFRPTLERVQATYGEGYEPIKDQPAEVRIPIGRAGEAEFAEAEQMAAVDAFVERAAGTAMDGMIDVIKQLVDEADSLEEIRDKLFAQFSEMDADALGMVLQEAMIAAQLAGRYEVQEGE